MIIPMVRGSLKGRRRRGVVLSLLILMLGLGLVAVSRSRTGSALLKSKSGFTSHPVDPRVMVEAGALRYADSVAVFLQEAIGIVETMHGRPFMNPVEVYVCGTQRSLNEFMGLSPDAPIRGSVRLGEVYLAPSAFNWRGADLHRESLLHELSHLHLRQYLGSVAGRGKVPSWFHEGLADMVSGAGGEGISEAAARSAILDGRALRPESTGHLWSFSRVTSYGLPGPMFHRQSGMFVTFIRERDPSAFRRFLQRLETEKEFSGPFREEMGMPVAEMWRAFVSSLSLQGSDGIDAQGPPDRNADSQPGGNQ